jgi:hypothetical protein
MARWSLVTSFLAAVSDLLEVVIGRVFGRYMKEIEL